MAGATRVTTMILLGAAVAIAAACKGDEKKDDDKGFRLPPGWTPPSTEPLDAGAENVIPKEAEGWVVVDPGSKKLVLVSQAIVKLRPTKDSRAEGTMWFTMTDDGLKLEVEMEGLAFMTKYAVRVHMLGDCSSDDGMSAGPPFNFTGSSLDPENGPATGLLGELQAAVEGKAKGTTIAGSAALQGHYSILGRSIVLHAPPGATTAQSPDPLGPRIACGVIGILAAIESPAAPAAASGVEGASSSAR